MSLPTLKYGKWKTLSFVIDLCNLLLLTLQTLFKMVIDKTLQLRIDLI